MVAHLIQRKEVPVTCGGLLVRDSSRNYRGTAYNYLIQGQDGKEGGQVHT